MLSWRFYTEFLIFRTAESVCQMSTGLERNFDIAMSHKALTNIYMNTAFGAPCYKEVWPPGFVDGFFVAKYKRMLKEQQKYLLLFYIV